MNESQPQWPEVTAFRRAARERFRALRAAADDAVRKAIVANVDAVIAAASDAHRAGGDRGPLCCAFYWPILGEVNLRAAMERADVAGVTVALPVVSTKNEPLVFRQWAPGAAMERGIWNIPVPKDTPEVHPHLLFIPVVAFDDDRFRLGNGGGYYDRTLAARSPRPRAIGIGMQCLRLPTIYPQAHDLPMDLIVTELPLDAVELRAAVAARVDCASPPCGLEDVD